MLQKEKLKSFMIYIFTSASSDRRLSDEVESGFTFSSTKGKLKYWFALCIFLHLIIYLCLTVTCLPCLGVTLTETLIESKSKETKWNGVKTFNYNLRNMQNADSSEELEFLLNIRKLILFTVHDLNKHIKNTGCVKWWANPLDLISYEEISKFDGKSHLKIEFILQPGNTVNMIAEILQKDAPIDIIDSELEIVNFKLIGATIGPCENETLSEMAKQRCVCFLPPALEEMEKITDETRQMWNLSDPELTTWHPSKSFMVPDYMNFTDYESFITSPGNTKDEVTNSSNKYSSEFCGPNLKMLVMISSNPTHFVHRKNIRETFASQQYLEGKGIKVVFLMGIPTNASIHAAILKEAAISQDIIQANFQDSYHNLSISHLSMYKWIQLTCENGKDQGVTLPKFLLKADDDVFLNVELALKVGEANLDTEFTGALFCGGKVVRNVALMTKYYTPRYMHISSSYAGYLSGEIYIMQTHVIPRMLHMSLTTPMIHMDDAYIGILQRKLQLYPRHSPIIAYVRNEPGACITKSWVSSGMLTSDDLLTQWKAFIEPTPSNCSFNNFYLKNNINNKVINNWCFFN